MGLADQLRGQIETEEKKQQKEALLKSNSESGAVIEADCRTPIILERIVKAATDMAQRGKREYQGSFTVFDSHLDSETSKVFQSKWGVFWHLHYVRPDKKIAYAVANKLRSQLEKEGFTYVLVSEPKKKLGLVDSDLPAITYFIKVSLRW